MNYLLINPDERDKCHLQIIILQKKTRKESVSH